ncbi:MAG: hypothetical protein WEC59_06800 [Salibacteraceae bacterium]
MKELSYSVETLSKKADALLTAFEKRNERIAQLEQEKLALAKKMEGLESEMKRLKEDNKVLKMASALKGNEESVTESKRRIGELVREIDKCLALLND